MLWNIHNLTFGQNFDGYQMHTHNQHFLANNFTIITTESKTISYNLKVLKGPYQFWYIAFNLQLNARFLDHVSSFFIIVDCIIIK